MSPTVVLLLNFGCVALFNCGALRSMAKCMFCTTERKATRRRGNR